MTIKSLNSALMFTVHSPLATHSVPTLYLYADSLIIFRIGWSVTYDIIFDFDFVIVHGLCKVLFNF